MKRRLVPLALLGLLLGVVLAGCREGTDPNAGAGYRTLPADYVLTGVQNFVTEDGIRSATLNADTAYYYADSAMVSLRNVHLQMFDKAGKPTAVLTSRRGHLNERTNAMVAEGNVVLVMQDSTGERIETQQLHYDPQGQGRIWSDVRTTRIEKDGSRLTGDGFTADAQMQHVVVTHPQGTVKGMKVTF